MMQIYCNCQADTYFLSIYKINPVFNRAVHFYVVHLTEAAALSGHLSSGVSPGFRETVKKSPEL